MAAQFNEIPDGQLTPFSFIEFSTRYTNTSATQDYTALIYGQMDGGLADENKYLKVNNLKEAKQNFGEHSELYRAIVAFRTNDQNTALVACGQNPKESDTQTIIDFVFKGAATVASTIELVVEDRLLEVEVTAGETAEDIVLKMATAVNLKNVSFTAVTNTNALTLASKASGKNTAFINVELSGLPAGVSIERKNTAGTGLPDLTDAIEAMQEVSYNIIISCYSDDANLKLIKEILDKRWDYETQLDGILFASRTGINDTDKPVRSKYISYVASQSITRPSTCTASYAGVVCRAAQVDPSRPFQTLEIKSVAPTADDKRLSRQERNELLKSGYSTYITSKHGDVLLERAVTSFIQDKNYRDINTLLTLSYLRFDFRATIQQKYPRHKIASDNTKIPSGQAIITPALAKAEAIAIFNRWESIGLVQNVDELKNQVIVEIDQKDRNRLNWILPTDLINQLRVTAAQIAFGV